MAPHTTGIYEIRNTVNGKRYVGSAVQFAKRWREHRRQLLRGCHHSKALQRAWNMYGDQSFQFSMLLICAREHLIMYEQACMDAYKPEYNCAPRAGSQLGYKHTAESRARMSASRPKDFSPMTGLRQTAEAKAKISARKTGVQHGPYHNDRVVRAAAAMRLGKGAATEEQVREVRRLKALGHKHQLVADAVGVSYHVVADIVRGRCFSWVN